MNLVPFEFVGWLLLLAALLLTAFALATGMRPLRSAAAALCLVAAAAFYNATGVQLSLHSPITVQEGVVTDIGHLQVKGGSPYETIQLRQDTGQLAPVFDTRGILFPQGHPHVHPGDRMRASFYTWTYAAQHPNHEREPFALSILTGQATGWSYRDPPPGWTLTRITTVLALAFLCLSLYRTRRKLKPASK